MRNRGFTLLEVMLAVAIVASVLAAVYASFRAVTVAWSATDRSCELSELGWGVLRLMGNELESALARGPGGVGSYRFLGVDGGERKDASDRLTFVFATEPWTLGYGWRPLVRVYYYVDELPGGTKRLVRMERPAQVGGPTSEYEWPTDSLILDVDAFVDPGRRFVPEDLEEAWVEVLAEDVVGMRVSYFDGTLWQTSWDSDTALPEAVAISLGLRGGSGELGAGAGEEFFTVVRLRGRGDLHVREGGGAGLPGIAGGEEGGVQTGETGPAELPPGIELPPPPPGERERGGVRGR